MWISPPSPPNPLPRGGEGRKPRSVGFNPRCGTCSFTPCGTLSGFVSRAGHRTQGSPLRGQPWAGEFNSFRVVPDPGRHRLWSHLLLGSSRRPIQHIRSPISFLLILRRNSFSSSGDEPSSAKTISASICRAVHTFSISACNSLRLSASL